MGRPEIEVPDVPFVFGADCESLCRDCQLPCTLDVTSIDCFRRFFLQGMIQCTYFVHGYCFMVDQPGCAFDNGGDHEAFWMGLLNNYFHNVGDVEDRDGEFKQNVQRARKMVDEQIAEGRVKLCRYFEEYYNRVMEEGGGLSEDVMEKLDEAYMALLSGVGRKA